MPVETRGQWAERYRAVLFAEPESTEESELGREGSVGRGEEVQPVPRGEQSAGWWEDTFGEMATAAGAEGKLKFSGKKGEGLTIKQFELMVKGSLRSRFKKLQKDVGEPIEGPEFLGSYCIFLGEFLDNPAKLAHEREYEAHCRESDPVGALLCALKRHFGERKEDKAYEWVRFNRKPGEDLPSLLFRLRGLAEDLGKQDEQELAAKFVTALEWRLAEQTVTLAMLLEETGFALRGNAGASVRDGSFRSKGPALNRHGGLLSFGHSGVAGGMAHLVEAVVVALFL